MRKAAGLIVLSTLIVSGAQSATFYPENVVPIRMTTGAFRGEQVRIAGRTYTRIDDMLFDTLDIPRGGAFGRRWPGARVVYDASDLSPQQVEQFRAACGLWERSTKVRCVPRAGESGGYVKVDTWPGNHSMAKVGYPGSDDVSPMNICCFDNSMMVAHEIGHVLGMAHEHVRPDRANHVKVAWDNIQPGGKSQFRWLMNMDVYGDYDFLSVMHYKQDNFSRNGKPTLLVLSPNEKYQSVIGTVSGPSASDIAGVNARYP